MTRSRPAPNNGLSVKHYRESKDRYISGPRSSSRLWWRTFAKCSSGPSRPRRNRTTTCAFSLSVAVPWRFESRHFHVQRTLWPPESRKWQDNVGVLWFSDYQREWQIPKDKSPTCGWQSFPWLHALEWMHRKGSRSNRVRMFQIGYHVLRTDQEAALPSQA